MSLLEIFKGLFGFPDKPQHDYIASTMSFMELDIEEMKKKLELKEAGVIRGKENQPSEHTDYLDDIEQKIVSSIESEKKYTYEKYINNLKTYGDRIKSLGFQTKFTQIVAAADTAIVDFMASVHDGVDVLFQLRRDLAQRDFNK